MGGLPKPDFNAIQALHSEDNLKVSSYSKRWSRLLCKITGDSEANTGTSPSKKRTTKGASPLSTPRKKAKTVKQAPGIDDYETDTANFDEEVKNSSPSKTRAIRGASLATPRRSTRAIKQAPEPDDSVSNMAGCDEDAMTRDSELSTPERPRLRSASCENEDDHC